MKPWPNRPRDIRNLFNPAFCGLVLSRGIEGYNEKSEHSMPFSLSLLILPLSLHKNTREIIKKSNRSYFTNIVQDNPEICINLAERIIGLFPYMMEAYDFLMKCNCLYVDDHGLVYINPNTIKKKISGSQDTIDCQTVASSIGKKMALINDRITIYTMLRIKP